LLPGALSPLRELELPGAPRRQFGALVPDLADRGDEHVEAAVARPDDAAHQPLGKPPPIDQPLSPRRDLGAVRQRNRLRVNAAEPCDA
jgi:hypothetical protein